MPQLSMYPCDHGTGRPMGYHHFVAGPSGIICCTHCGARPKEVAHDGHD